MAQLSVANPELASKFKNGDSVMKYLDQHYEIARATPEHERTPGTMYGNVIIVYEEIIKPCREHCIPYALKSPGDFDGPIRTIWVEDVVGDAAPISTIYDAIALVITLSEADVHAHPGEHDYYTELVKVYGRMCHSISSTLTPGPAHRPPTTIAVVYGNLGPGVKKLPGFKGSHACSLSTSIPEIPAQPSSGSSSWCWAAEEARREFLKKAIPLHEEHFEELRRVVGGQDPEPWGLGHCAEVLPMIRLAMEGDMLQGACIYRVQRVKLKGPHICSNCGTMMNCLSRPYVDKVASEVVVYPRPITRTRSGPKLAEPLHPPEWNQKVYQEALSIERAHTVSTTTATTTTITTISVDGACGPEVGYVGSTDTRDGARGAAHPGTQASMDVPPSTITLTDIHSPTRGLLVPQPIISLSPSESCGACLEPSITQYEQDGSDRV